MEKSSGAPTKKSRYQGPHWCKKCYASVSTAMSKVAQVISSEEVLDDVGQAMYICERTFIECANFGGPKICPYFAQVDAVLKELFCFVSMIIISLQPTPWFLTSTDGLAWFSL
ncbi:hypothetical protein KC19_7G170200 [Ceratodon purpureus]|uniref:Uncharacterized protein n=1 Tax=Ceratodon purpureus TaxID=3225 RepID=A0A8T0HB50_CERPU|nr:hypothetical protein KC19_7G170200 [Ceratodon purpureus]